jgi:hypothetical protein
MIAAVLAALVWVVVPASASAEEPQVKVTFSCTSVTYTFTGFPEASNNTVTENVYVDGTIVATKVFKFNGPTGSNSVTVHVPPGKHKMDARARWNTNGVKGSRDTPLLGGIECSPEPGMSIEKRQRIGSKHPYTTSLLAGKVGETVEYEMIVTNTGNVPLTLSNFTDEHCDGGTIVEGPGENPLPPYGSKIYFCSHVLTGEDDKVGFRTNTASEEATPPEGPPFTKESNTVVVELPTPGGHVSEFGCEEMTFVFEGFPNLPNNTVTELVKIDGVTVLTTKFTFNGPFGENTVHFSNTPGHHKVDGRAKWNTNGFKGGFDQPARFGVTCP